MIKYTEKGYWLHKAILMAGHRLEQTNNIWITDDEASVQTIIDDFDPLPHARAEAHQRIDAAAGEARARYVTTAPGQEATYLMKEQQARAYQATGDIGPMLQMEADSSGMSVADMAALIVVTADQWQMLAAAIEARRMGAKRAVSAATDWQVCGEIAGAAVADLEAM